MKAKRLIYLVSFLEGSALMASELLSAKIMAPYFGTSLTVWTSVFVCTLSALATGYFVGASISTRKNPGKNLFFALLVSGLLLLIMHPLAQFIMEATINMGLAAGSLVSSLVFLFPLLVCFGVVSPLAIKIMTERLDESGEKAGLVYTVSTIGGIIATLLFGLTLIPEVGIKTSILISATLVFSATLLMFILNKKIQDGN